MQSGECTCQFLLSESRCARVCDDPSASRRMLDIEMQAIASVVILVTYLRALLVVADAAVADEQHVRVVPVACR